MQKMAQQAGVSMESFSKMAYAAKSAGLPVEAMSTILTRISHSSFEAASGNKQAAAAYKELGVSVTDANGHFLTADQIVLGLAKSLDQYKDSAAKTGLEMMIMGRSGAQSAEFLKVLATRFDEVSDTAQKLGIVFSQGTAQGAQKLHESILQLEEAGLGLSVRLLSQVSPALDQLAQKIVAIASSTESMAKVEQIGKELADGIMLAGDALEFLVRHFGEVKTAVEALAAIRLAGIFGPMVISATEATGIFGKLGIASLNLTGNVLGIRKLGSAFVPLATSAVGYSKALGGLAVTEGVAATGALAMSDAMAAARAAMVAFVETVPLAAAIAAAFYEVATTIHNIHDDFDLASEAGKSFWDVQNARAEEARSSLSNYIGVLKEAYGFKDAVYKADMANRLGIKTDPNGILATPKAPGLPDDYFSNPAMTGKSSLKDLAALPGDVKPDELAKKLADLKEKADAAQRALALVGASPQQQQNSEILEQYNTFLADEKFHLDQLTPAKRASAEADAHAYIGTIVNIEALKNYRQALFDLSTASQSNIAEHLAMAAAIGKSAKAMQDAAVAAQVNQEFQKFGSNWQNDPSKRADAEKRAAEIRASINADNQNADRQTASGMQLQIDAQSRLNAAILQGAEARRQAAIVSEQAAVRADFISRKDTDQDALQQQLDAVRQRSDAEKEAADLERANGLDVTARYREQTQAIMDAVNAAEKYGTAIDFRDVLAADKEAWIEYSNAQDKAILATGDAMDGLKVALGQMARDTESSAQIMADAVQHAIQTMNDAMASVLTEHHKPGSHDVRNQFSGAFRGIGNDLARTGLQKAESGILKGFGLGKPDGTSQNPWYVKLVGGANKSGTGNELDALTSHLTNQSASSAGSAVGSVVGTLAKTFLPGFADGTDAMVPGMPSIVGEKGPELFIPPSAGAVVPNSRLKGSGMVGDVHNHIDARGSNDPAQTVALINQALDKAAPQIIAHSVRAVHETKLRVPATSR
jgi:hypothetical protein